MFSLRAEEREECARVKKEGILEVDIYLFPAFLK